MGSLGSANRIAITSLKDPDRTKLFDATTSTYNHDYPLQTFAVCWAETKQFWGSLNGIHARQRKLFSRYRSVTSS
jgi:hypothetical protein